MEETATSEDGVATGASGDGAGMRMIGETDRSEDPSPRAPPADGEGVMIIGETDRSEHLSLQWSSRRYEAIGSGPRANSIEDYALVWLRRQRVQILTRTESLPTWTTCL